MKKNDQTIGYNSRILNRIIFLLSILGLVMAIYVLQGFIRKSPIVCINTGCEAIRKNPLSYPLGIPIPAFGLTGYLLLSIIAFFRTTSSNPILLKSILAISIGGVIFVSWFTTVEIFIIHAICTWCAFSAINMVIIFIISLKSFFLTTKL